MLYIISGFCVVVLIVLLISEREKPWISDLYAYTTMILLLIVGVASLITVGFLVNVIRRTFTDELNREMMQLCVSQIIFVFTFILRVGLFFANTRGYWVNFTSDYPYKMNNKFLTAMFPI